MGERSKAITVAIETARRGTLAEAEAALAMLLGEEQEVADVFYTQQEMIGSLTDLLAIQDQQVTYVSPPAPLPRSTNYLLYAVLGIAALIYFGKIKL